MQFVFLIISINLVVYHLFNYGRKFPKRHFWWEIHIFVGYVHCTSRLHIFVGLTLKISVQKSKRKDIGFEHFEFQKSMEIIIVLLVVVGFVLCHYLIDKWCQRRDIEAATQPPPSTSSHRKEVNFFFPCVHPSLIIPIL